MIKTVLCAVDVSRTDVEAKVLQRAWKFAQAEEAQLDVITVIPDYGMSVVGGYFDKDHTEKATAKARELLITFIGQTVFYLMVYLILQVEAGSDIAYEVEPNELWNLPSVVSEFWITLTWKTERGARYLIRTLFGEPRESVNTEIPYRSLREVLQDQKHGKPKPASPLKRHENEDGKDYTLKNLKRELRRYKKRHSRFLQKKMDAERRGKSVTQRTLDAIENNANWVAHFERLILEKELESQLS